MRMVVSPLALVELLLLEQATRLVAAITVAAVAAIRRVKRMPIMLKSSSLGMRTFN